MPRPAILLAVLIGTVFVAFVGLIVLSEIVRWKRATTTGWVFIDKDGRVAIPGPFEETQPFRQGLAAVKREGRWGFVDRAGREVLPPRFRNAGSFSAEGLAPAVEDGDWGYVRRDGSWAIAPRYDRAREFVEGRAIVSNSVGWRFSSFRGSSGNRIYSDTLIDADGKEIAPVRARKDPGRLTLYAMTDGLSPVQLADGKPYGWVDRDLRLVIAARFAGVGDFSEGLAPAQEQEGGAWGYVDTTGKFAISPAFRSAEPFREGLAVVGNERYGFLRRDGSRAFEATFEWARSFSGGLAAVRTEAGWGFIDRTGRIVVEPAYADIGGSSSYDVGFSEERAAVALPSGTLDRRWGFIDVTGRLVIPATFLEVSPPGFSEGLCAVRVPR